jgi:dTMP kinase
MAEQRLNMTKTGRFITFEGGEGAGKSTQIKRLSAHLMTLGLDHIVTREPGGSDLAEKIRTLLVEGGVDGMDALTEYLLFSAARRDHLTRVIHPALAAGQWVLCDRFYDSSLVYQGLAPDPAVALDKVLMQTVYEEVAGKGFAPDLTFIFDLDPKVGLARAGNRSGQNLNVSRENRFESKGIDFHQRVREGFLKLPSSILTGVFLWMLQGMKMLFFKIFLPF